MRLVTTLISACLAIVMLLGAATASLAAGEAGTHAWSVKPLILASGPDRSFPVTGQIPAETAIKVLRCQRDWCLVSADNQRGWASSLYVDFGRHPEPVIVHGRGNVCFFEGTNFTGASACFNSGTTIDDLALQNLDNRFASVQLTGAVSVATCRDRYFQSYCERIVQSKPALPTYLRGTVSSIKVY